MREINTNDFKNYHPKYEMAYENGVHLKVELDFAEESYTYIVETKDGEWRYAELSWAIEAYNSEVFLKDLKKQKFDRR